LTAVGVAASTLEVVLVESESCTAPATLVVAEAMEMSGLVPPEEEIGEVPVTVATFVPARSYALFTLAGVAAVVVEVEETESVSCSTPAADVDPAETETVIAVVPVVLIGEVPETVATLAAASSNAAFTAVGVAARMLLVVEVESESWTAPDCEVEAEAIEIAGVDPPEEAIGLVPVTEVTPPEAAAHFIPVVSAESAVNT
jgi:hypothetical protein